VTNKHTQIITQVVPASHLCYLNKKAERKNAPKPVAKFIFFDFECTQDTVYTKTETSTSYKHEVNLCCVQRVS
jgi:hypothetical protein